jgi:hypothetical protein
MVATPATQGAPSADPRVGSAVAGTRTAERLRAVVLGPRGGGTTRLPPIWGWVTLAWMRRREYV